MIEIKIYEADFKQLLAVANKNGVTIAEVVSTMIANMNAINAETGEYHRHKHRRVGRPTVQKDDIPKSFVDGYDLYKKGSLNISQLARLARVSRPTVYKYIRILEQKE